MLSLTLGKDGFVKNKFKNFINMRSQNFSDSYMDAAQQIILKNQEFSSLKTLYVKLNRFEFMDVDNIEDFNDLKKSYRNIQIN